MLQILFDFDFSIYTTLFREAFVSVPRNETKEQIKSQYKVEKENKINFL